MGYKPLGTYEPLPPSKPLPWSTDPGCTVTHGSGVLENLIAGINEHRETAANGYWSRLGATPAAIGCVPYFTSDDVAGALAELRGGCCIVVDKQQRDWRAVQALVASGGPLSSLFLDGFDDLAVPDEHGQGPIIGPYSPRLEPVELGPVRVAGWQAPAPGAPWRPLLHSKLLVLGVTTYWESDDYFSDDVARFEPKCTWMGSANWTRLARTHIEFGLWSTDAALVKHNYDYLLALIRFSEPYGAMTASPEPQLVAADWDDQAFIEYLAEHPDEPDDDEP